jgi:hypothetical protein
MRGLYTDRTAAVIISRHALCIIFGAATNWHWDMPPALRLAVAFTELAQAI